MDDGANLPGLGLFLADRLWKKVIEHVHLLFWPLYCKRNEMQGLWTIQTTIHTEWLEAWR
jgi:hypothetical protein